MTCAPLIIFAPGFYEGDPPADATLLEKLPPVVTCEKRLLGFARNSKIFWLGNAPVDHQYDFSARFSYPAQAKNTMFPPRNIHYTTFFSQ